MSDHPDSPPPDPALEEAVDWFVRRDAGPFSEAEERSFEAWLAADPAHGAAYREIERIWSDAERLPVTAPPRPQSRFRQGAAMAVAASLLLLVLVGLDVPTRLQADARSGVGETKTVTLPDGSTAMLNTASAIAVDYTADERRVRLLSGEAAFTVARDAGRPFRVEASGGLSTALGTVFLVRALDDGATVTVLESRVAVALAGGKAVLAPNQRVSYAADRGLGPVESVDARAAMAWRRGKLIFADRRLGEVIEELNRYHLGEIRILDPALAERKVSGVFETRDPVAAVDALESSLGLRSTRLSDLLILLH